jgi:hypothetical protein
MLDIVAPYDDELALSIKREYVHYAEPRRATTRGAGNAKAMCEYEPVKPKHDANNNKKDDHAEEDLQRAAFQYDVTQRLQHNSRLKSPLRRKIGSPGLSRTSSFRILKRLSCNNGIKSDAA